MIKISKKEPKHKQDYFVKYRNERCVRKELVFYPSELELLDKAEDRAIEQDKSFTKYVKDLIRDDVD